MRGYSSFEKQHVAARNNQQNNFMEVYLDKHSTETCGKVRRHEQSDGLEVWKFWKIPKLKVLENMLNGKAESWKFTHGNSIESLHWKTYNVWRNNEEYYVLKM